MFIHHRGRLAEVTPQVLFQWFTLSFMAGSINAGGFLACNRFVSHITGFATQAGVDFANFHLSAGIGMLTVPLFFVMGVMLSAYLMPRYQLVMGMVMTCLLIVAAGGYFRLFGTFGDALFLRRDFLFMALLCMASGLTNAAITTSTGAFVRVTHLTGVTTDLGIGVVRLFAMDPTHADYRTEKMSNYYRAGTILSFTAGSFAGALLFLRIEYLGFLLPASVAFYAMRRARRTA